MIVAVPRETLPGERRVALIPAGVAALTKAGLEVAVQSGAGAEAGYPDQAYQDKGAKLVESRDELFGQADCVVQVRTPGANPEQGTDDLGRYKPGQIVIGFSEPLLAHDQIRQLAEAGVSLLAMELLPRITRAQSMDALSSMATIAGYKSVLLAANTLPRMFPMLMTAAGTITPAKVLVLGVGVAGLQAISAARRLGAVVSAYDIRPAVREQVESVGGKFVTLDIQVEGAEDTGGYAKAQSEDFILRQQEALGRVVADHDVVITTAAVPGKKAPILVTEAMVRGMQPGTVIVDLAAERGGNCELTQADQVVTEEPGVTIIGTTNLPATVPYHASQMYGKNIQNLVNLIAKDGQLQLNTDDEIVAGMLVCRDGEIVNPRIREALGLETAAE